MAVTTDTERGRIQRIHTLCGLIGRPDVAAQYVKDGTPLAAVQSQLYAAMFFRGSRSPGRFANLAAKDE